MRVGIHLDPLKQKNEFIKKYESILLYNKIDYCWLDINNKIFWKEIENINIFILRWSHYDAHRGLAKTLLPILETHYKVTCFPDQNTSWHYDDKIRQYYLLKKYNYPIIESWIFWDKKDALLWIKKAHYPIVFKLKKGAGSKNVILVKDYNQAKHLVNLLFNKGIKNANSSRDAIDSSLINKIKRKIYNKKQLIINNDLPYWKIIEDWNIEKNYIYFQKYLPNNTYDTRITIIGERAFGFIRENRFNDFRASGSGKINYDKTAIDLKCVEIAFEISRKLEFQSMAYDFIYNEDGKPEFCEISYTYLDTAVYQCEGYWDKNLNWNEGHYWPQYFQLIDLLNDSKLKQPNL